MIDTDKWPFVPARYFTPFPVGQRRAVRLIVIHDMEAPEKGETAEAIARYFQTVDFATEGKKPSAHVCIDNNSVVQCVHDNDIANAAPGANSDGVHLELAGYGAQTRGQWLDDYSRAVIDNAANVAAQYCLKYEIPPTRIQTDELADKTKRGICSHAQVSAAFKKSDHTDPGANFPWDYFFDRVHVHLGARLAAHGPVKSI